MSNVICNQSITGTLAVSGNSTFTGTITSGNITTQSRITFDYGGDHYIETGTNSIAFKNSSGSSTLTLGFGDQAATFYGTVTIPSYIYHQSDPSDDTYFGFSGNDTFVVYTAGGSGLNIDSNRAVTLTGALTGTSATFDGGIDIDNINIDGTKIDLSSGSLEIEAASNIILDADSDEIHLQGSGTAFGKFFVSGSNFYINHPTADQSIIFSGTDSSTSVAALTLNMADAGGATFNDYIQLGASKKIYLGGSDSRMHLYHTGSGGHAYVLNKEGALNIMTEVDDGNIVFTADDGAGGNATYFSCDGGSATHSGSATTALYTKWPDNSRVALGSGHDLQLYHDGTNSQIRNLAGSLDFEQHADDGNIRFYNDDGAGGAALYYYLAGAEATHSGSATTALYTIWQDNSIIALGTGKDLRVYHDGSNSTILNVTGDLEIKSTATDGDIAFRADDGAGGFTTYFWLDGGEATHDGSATTATYTMWADKSRIALGAGKDLQIYHDGSNSYISEQGTGNLFIEGSSNMYFRNTDRDEYYATFADDGAVNLYHNNTIRLATDASGVTITSELSSATAKFTDNVYMSGGQLYIGALDSSTDDTYRIYQSSGQFILASRESGTWTTRFDIDTSGDATFTGDIEAPGIYVGSTNTSYDFYNNGTSYLNGATTIDAAAQINGTVTVGVDDTGYDVTFHGATAGKYMKWDESADRLEIVGDMSITGDGSNAVVISESGSGHLTVDAPGDINLDADGEQINFKHAGSTIVTLNVDSTPELDVTGDFTIDGTGDVTIIPADDLILSAGGDTEFARLQHAPTGGDVVKFSVKGNFPDSVGWHFGTGASSDGDASILHDGSNWYFDTNTGDIILDAAGDQIRFKDGGSERIVFNLDSTPEMDVTGNFTIDCSGDITLDAAGDQIYMKDAGTTAFTFNCDSTPQLDVSRGNFTIDVQTNDADFILKGEDGMSTITALTVDMSEAGKATFNNDVVAFSDRRLKKDIKTLDGSKVYDMRGVSFTRIDTDNPGAGVIAQEMQEVAPELVTETNDTLGVSYGNLTGYLIEAIKDLKAEVEELKKQVKDGGTK